MTNLIRWCFILVDVFEINKTIARDESNAVEKVDQRGGVG